MTTLRASLLVLVLFPTIAFSNEKISGTWMTLAEVEDAERLCRYVVYRETGASPRMIVTVHESEFVERDEKGHFIQIYREEPCDIWIDLDRDGTLEPNEHRRRKGDEHVCRFNKLPGSVQLQVDGSLVVSLTVFVEKIRSQYRIQTIGQVPGIPPEGVNADITH